MSNHDLTSLSTIDLDALASVTGGDGWQDYKNTLSQDWSDTKDRYHQAVDHNLVNGHWDLGQWADGYAGMVYDGGKTIWDATGGLIAKAFK
jgi:hypothetical protein